MWTKSRDGKTLTKCGAVTAALARPGTASATHVATPAARPAARARAALGTRADCRCDEAPARAFVWCRNTEFPPRDPPRARRPALRSLVISLRGDSADRRVPNARGHSS